MYNDEEEPDFTCGSEETEQTQRPVAASQAVTEGEAVREDVRLPWRYSEGNLNPTEKDPSCKKPNWPLASFWPVYVGNFKVEFWQDAGQEQAWYEQVSNYFAYRCGLLTRMVFFNRSQDTETFKKYQKNCHLVDMLVYFTSKVDAERAIETCHRDSYYGYNINVLPGRTPVFFDNTRSVRFVDLAFHYPVEWNIEDTFAKQGPVSFVGRYPERDVIVEFGTTEAMVSGIASQMKWKPVPLKEATPKQRFLEEDVIMEIEWIIESNPAFMDQKPNPAVLEQLFEGTRPHVPTPWEGHTKAIKAPLFKQNRMKEKRRKMQLMEKHQNRAKMPRTEIVSRDGPPRPPAGGPSGNILAKQTRRQKEADNVEAINWMLRQHGAGTTTKTAIREREAQQQQHQPPRGSW